MDLLKSAYAKVALIFASGLAVNKLSDLFEASAPLAIGGALVVLTFLLISESRPGGRAANGKASRDPANRDLVKFSLASVLLGALVGGAAILPVFEGRTYWGIFPGTYFHSYELGAAAVLSFAAAVAAFRRTSLLRVATFVLCSIAGMTLLLVTIAPGNRFTITFVGWSAAASIITLCGYLLPDINHLFWGFLAGRHNCAAIRAGGRATGPLDPNDQQV